MKRITPILLTGVLATTLALAGCSATKEPAEPTQTEVVEEEVVEEEVVEEEVETTDDINILEEISQLDSVIPGDMNNSEVTTDDGTEMFLSFKVANGTEPKPELISHVLNIVTESVQGEVTKTTLFITDEDGNVMDYTGAAEELNLNWETTPEDELVILT